MSFDYKNNSLDFVRYFAVIQVILGHYFMFYEKLSENPILPLNWFGGMITLFSISGFLAIPSIEKIIQSKPTESHWTITRTYLKSRFLRILPPYYLCCVVSAIYILITYPYKPRIKDFLLWIISTLSAFHITPEYLGNYASGSTNGSMWSIFVILQFYLFIALFYKIIKNMSKFSCIFMIFTSVILNVWCGYFCRENPYSRISKIISRSLIPYLYFFLIGVAIYKYKDKLLPFLSRYWYLILSLYVILQVGLMNLYIPIGHYTNPFVGTTLCVVSVTMGYIPIIKNYRIKNDISYELILYHFPIMNALIFYGVSPGGHALFMMISFTVVISLLAKYVVNNTLYRRIRTK